MEKTRKKSQVDPMKVIMGAIIILVVVIIVLVIFRNIIGKESKNLEQQVGGLSDYDGDGIADFIDPCPCDPNKQAPCDTTAALCSTEIQNSKK